MNTVINTTINIISWWRLIIPAITGDAGSWKLSCQGFEEWITASDALAVNTENGVHRYEKRVRFIFFCQRHRRPKGKLYPDFVGTLLPVDALLPVLKMENSNKISYSMILNTSIGTSKASANCPFGTPIKGLYHSPVATICPPNGTHLIRTFATKGRPNDLVSNSITQIKNGYSRRFDQVYLPYSKETLQLSKSSLMH